MGKNTHGPEEGMGRRDSTSWRGEGTGVPRGSASAPNPTGAGVPEPGPRGVGAPSALSFPFHFEDPGDRGQLAVKQGVSTAGWRGMLRGAARGRSPSSYLSALGKIPTDFFESVLFAT